MRSLADLRLWLFPGLLFGLTLGLTLGLSAAVPAHAAAPCGGDFGDLAQRRQAGSRGGRHFPAGDPIGARRRDLRSRRSSPAITPRACSARASSNSPAAWCRRGCRAAGECCSNIAALLGRIEQQYGVPGPVIVAIWGLETDFGADTGKFPDHPRAGDARLRLPPAGQIPRRTARCAAHRRARRHGAGARCAAPGRARSGRRSFCRRRI